MNKIYFLLPFLFFSCYRVSNKIEPKIEYSIHENYLNKAKTFEPLSHNEKQQDWGKEYNIGYYFAEKLELYQALVAFKRANILISKEDFSRKHEIEYFIVLCYFLGHKYTEAINAFENSSLVRADKSFKGFHDLLLILYESYLHLKNDEKASSIKKILQEYYPITHEQIEITTAFLNADFQTLKDLHLDYVDDFLKNYELKKKSPLKAQTLNAVIPGSGYLYLGLKKSAVTSFLLNGLFIYAAYEFFSRKYIAAGAITTSFAAGWYFGGIYGAGEEAKYYNEKLYSDNVCSLLYSKKLFPFFMIKYCF